MSLGQHKDLGRKNGEQKRKCQIRIRGSKGCKLHNLQTLAMDDPMVALWHCLTDHWNGPLEWTGLYL